MEDLSLCPLLFLTRLLAKHTSDILLLRQTVLPKTFLKMDFTDIQWLPFTSTSVVLAFTGYLLVLCCNIFHFKRHKPI